MDDPNLDDWISGLSGQRDPNSPNDEAVTLRAVILQRRAAPDSKEASEVERLVAHLRKEGALPPRSSAEVTSMVGRSARPEISRPARRFTTNRLAASVAFLAVSVGVLLQLSRPALQHDPTEETRGAVGGLTLTDARPQDRAAQVQNEMQQIGVPSHLLPDAARQLIEVSVTEQRLPAFNAWMEAHGGAARAAGNYRIVIVAP
jgi:hypothetical protein